MNFYRPLDLVSVPISVFLRLVLCCVHTHLYVVSWVILHNSEEGNAKEASSFCRVMLGGLVELGRDHRMVLQPGGCVWSFPLTAHQCSGAELGLVHEREMGLSQDVPTIAPCDN